LCVACRDKTSKPKRRLRLAGSLSRRIVQLNPGPHRRADRLERLVDGGDVGEHDEQLSDGEISKYLDFNAEDSKFEKKAKKSDQTFWERADGKATAVSKEKSSQQVGRLEIWDYDAYPGR